MYYNVLLKPTLQGGCSEGLNSYYAVPKKKFAKYPFKVIQSLQKKFNYDDRRRSLQTINESRGPEPNDGNLELT